MVKQTVSLHVEPYGEFEAVIRDFEIELRINYRSDEQMTVRNFDPNRAGPSTRNLFYYLALFAETCEKAPTDFDIGKLLRSDPADAQSFLVHYTEALVEKEKSFRESSQDISQGSPVSATTETTV